LGVNANRQRGWSASQSFTSWVVRVERLSLIAITCRPAGISASSWSRKRSRSKRLRVFEGIAVTSPVCTRKAANRFWVPLRVYSYSRRARLPGRAWMSARVGAFAWMPVFSSIETTSAPSGGSR